MKTNKAPYGSDEWRKLDKENAIERAKARGVHYSPPSTKIDKSKTTDDTGEGPH